LNIKELFPEPPGWKKKGKFRARGMTDMLDWLDLDLEGRHHSGIDDTLNIGRVIIELLNKGTLKIKK
jgi:inhibitor of KinA sporulation pathway (predicted exonuclease)